MGILETILSPPFLVQNINILALTLGATLLVIFSDIINKHIVFPLADQVKTTAHSKLRSIDEKSKRMKSFSKYASDALATAIFILYCYFGAYVLAEFVFIPVFRRMKSFLLIVVIILFLIVSYIINDKKTRRKFIKT